MVDHRYAHMKLILTRRLVLLLWFALCSMVLMPAAGQRKAPPFRDANDRYKADILAGNRSPG